MIKIRLLLASLVSAAVAAAMPAAHAAGGHYRVDDADVVEFGRCQVETWYSRASGDNWETVVAPACHFVRDLEVTLEWNTVRDEGERGGSLVLEAKRLLPERARGRLLSSVVAGTSYETRNGEFKNVYLYVPASLDAADALTLHANLGWRWEEADGHLTIWGAAAEWRALPHLHLIGEVFGDGRGRSGQQVGLRPVLIDDRLHLDIAVAWDRLAGPEGSTWFTFAVNLVF
jgi:hypothetical protein